MHIFQVPLFFLFKMSNFLKSVKDLAGSEYQTIWMEIIFYFI